VCDMWVSRIAVDSPSAENGYWHGGWDRWVDERVARTTNRRVYGRMKRGGEKWWPEWMGESMSANGMRGRRRVVVTIRRNVREVSGVATVQPHASYSRVKYCSMS